MIDEKQIGERLKKEREKRGLDKTALATMAGLTRMQVRYIESGDRDYTAKALFKYCKAVGIEDFIFRFKR